MDKLYCLSLGGSMRNDFAETAQNLNQSGKYAVMLLPSAFLLNKVVEDGYHLTLFTFDGLAKDILSRGHEKRKFINRMTQELLMEELLAELSAAGQIPYFSSISAFPGYVGTMTNLIGEIKRSGTLPDEFSACVEALDNPQKNLEVDIIYHVYQEKLEKMGLLDLEELYFTALDLLRKEEFHFSYTHIFISDFYIFTPLQLEMIKLLKRQSQVSVALCYEKNKAGIYEAVQTTYEKLMGFGFEWQGIGNRDQRPDDLKFLCDHVLCESSQSSLVPDHIMIVKTCHKQKEMHVAAKHIKRLTENGQVPNEIAVVLRNSEGYEDIARVFSEYGIPVDIPFEVPVSGEPLPRLLNNCLLSQTKANARETMINIYKSPYMQAAYDIDSDYLEFVINKHIVYSWEDFQNAIEQEVLSDGKIKAMKDGIVDIYNLVTSIPSSGTSLQFYEALMGLIGALRLEKYHGDLYKNGDISLELLKRTLSALTVVKDAMEEVVNGLKLLGIAENNIKALQFSQYLTQVLADKKVGLVRAQGGVKIVNPASVHGVSYPVVYVMGLTEGEFPVIRRENWLYNDKERSELYMLGVEFLTTRALLQQENLYFASAVSMATDKLLLSCYEDDKFLESSYLVNVRDLFTEKIMYERYEVNQVFSEAFDEVYSYRELVCKTIYDAYHCREPLSDIACGLIQHVFSNMSLPFKNGLNENNHAWQSSDAVKDYYFALLGDPYSYGVSTVEDYAFCPFAFFIKRILNLDEWEIADQDPDTNVTGSIYHAVLAQFIKKFAGTRLEKARQDELWFVMEKIFDDVCREYMLKGELIDDKGFMYERQRMRYYLRQWLAFEIEEQAGYGVNDGPIITEWAFGRGKTPGLTIETALGPVCLNGVIDRIDKIAGGFVVYDYKTRLPQPFKRIKNGLALQIPLYLKAVKECLAGDDEVIGGGYYIIQDPQKTQGMWKKKLLDQAGITIRGNDCKLKDEDWDELAANIELYCKQYVEGIINRIFPVMPTEQCPSYCPGRSICRFGSAVMREEVQQ